jgi:hypothetical protein
METSKLRRLLTHCVGAVLIAIACTEQVVADTWTKFLVWFVRTFPENVFYRGPDVVPSEERLAVTSPVQFLPKQVKKSSREECDACGATALFVVTFKEGELFLCGHHKDQHEPALAAHGYEIRELEGARDAW